MHEYGYCGRRLRSRVPLPELEGGTVEAAAPVGWTCGPGTMPSLREGAPARSWVADDGTEWVRISRLESGFLLQFAAGVTFHVTRSSVSWSDPAVPADTLHHLLLDQVLPLALSLQDALVLHASCVASDGGAVLFVGPSGRGKSTLAAALTSRGFTLLADDCVTLREEGSAWITTPAYAGLRLWRDAAAHLAIDTSRAEPVAHYTSKVRVMTRRDGAGAVPLQRVYLLRWTRDGGPRLSRAGVEGVIDLLRCVFTLDTQDRDALSRDFARACALISGGLVRRLELPRSLDALDASVEALLDDGHTPPATTEASL